MAFFGLIACIQHLTVWLLLAIVPLQGMVSAFDHLRKEHVVAALILGVIGATWCVLHKYEFYHRPVVVYVVPFKRRPMSDCQIFGVFLSGFFNLSHAITVQFWGVFKF